MAKKRASGQKVQQADHFRHPEADSPMRPEVGTQARFKKKKPPRTYRYDSSLSPALDWDGQNPAREQGEALIRQILEAESLEEAKAAAEKLKALGRPFLDWAGKAERLSFDVPTLPLFVHERLSTPAIIKTLAGHKVNRETQHTLFDLFADPHHSIVDQAMRAYEHRDKWVNRMILGDSLAVMNSLLQYEGLGGQIQMVFIDPPYGVRYGSNFQPFVRKRDVAHGDDEDMTREPEMVQAYRDTWEIGLHSYLTYLRDRILVARDLLKPSGSIFVQIGDENVHHVRELLDEVFGRENHIAQITFVTTGGSTSQHMANTSDTILYYARDRYRLKYHQLFREKEVTGEANGAYGWLELPNSQRRKMLASERVDITNLEPGARVFTLDNLQSQSGGRQKGDGAACWFPVEVDGRRWTPNMKSTWKTNEKGMEKLKSAGRLQPSGDTLR